MADLVMADLLYAEWLKFFYLTEYFLAFGFWLLAFGFWLLAIGFDF